MSRFRTTPTFRSGWARLLACLDYEAQERMKANRKGEEDLESGRDRILYVVASRICDRWRAAGFTSATLVDGLPRPERPHLTTWEGEGRFRHCSVCGRSCFKAPLPATCDGSSGFDLVFDALARGVPFGLRDGLPTAGVPTEAGDVVIKLARATCRPVVTREEREAA